jgi:hypothetical protein
MAEPNPGFAGVAFTIQAEEERIIVPAEYAIVGAKGIFVRDRHLRVGTPVVVRVWKDQMAVSLLGVVCADYEDLGFAIQYT